MSAAELQTVQKITIVLFVASVAAIGWLVPGPISQQAQFYVKLCLFAPQTLYRLWRAAQPAADWRYAIHHFLALGITAALFYWESLLASVCVSAVHDMSEIAVATLRLATRSGRSIIVPYVSLVLSWFVGRLVLLPFINVYLITNVISQSIIWGLFILHCLWFIEIIQRGLKQLIN